MSERGGPDERRKLRDKRAAANEALFREVNERVAESTAPLRDWPWGAGHDEIAFVCECGHADCFEQIALMRDEYERIRSDPVYFVIKPGHEMPELEHVVERAETYLVVAKEGEAAEVAREYHARESGD